MGTSLLSAFAVTVTVLDFHTELPYFSEGDKVHLDPTCGFFMTMTLQSNTHCWLPEGIRILFRPVAVLTPNVKLIVENVLLSEGFLTGNVLASKLCALYDLFSDLLSNQTHYDW